MKLFSGEIVAVIKFIGRCVELFTDDGAEVTLVFTIAVTLSH